MNKLYPDQAGARLYRLLTILTDELPGRSTADAFAACRCFNADIAPKERMSLIIDHIDQIERRHMGEVPPLSQKMRNGLVESRELALDLGKAQS